jgi:hypothetical protein
MTSGGAFRDDIAAQVAAVGGQLQSNLSEIGVATAVSDDPNFAVRARKISGVWSVDADTVVEWVKPERMSEAVNLESTELQATEAVAHVYGEDEGFWNFQWNVRALNAPEAWAAGQIGTGARVAVIDGGMSKDHVDLKDRIDVAHSASFVPGKTWDQDAGTSSTFRHATHVAGIIAASDNGIGTIGVAPGATIVANSASGVTGAGNSPKRELLFAEVADDYRAYGVGNTHRHLKEMTATMSTLGVEDVDLVFTPHLIPVARGILSTITVPLVAELIDATAPFRSAYANELFVEVVKDQPRLSDVVHRNAVRMTATMIVGTRTPTMLVTSAIDNLVKGAAGQALQNANLMCGIDESTGLPA